MLDRVGNMAVAFHQDSKHKIHQWSKAVEINRDRFIRAREIEYLGQRFLAVYILPGAEETERDDVNDRDEQFTTFSEFERFEIELVVQKRDFLL